MLYFIEHDAAGNIVHVCGDPEATIVPLINRVVFNGPDGNPLKDAEGDFLSPFNSKLLDPVGIDKATFDALTSAGPDKYQFDGDKVVLRTVASGT